MKNVLWACGVVLVCLTYHQIALSFSSFSLQSSCGEGDVEGAGAVPSERGAAASSRGGVALSDLVHTQIERSCPDPLVLVHDTIHQVSSATENLIPRTVHLTARSRCLTPDFATLLDSWRFPNHSLYLHNDAAMHRLLEPYPEILACAESGAAQADLWRAVVLYEYGGIYTDLDNRPALFSGETIQPDDQALFVVERQGLLSQYFMAAAPKHPLFYLLIQSTLHQLLSVDDLAHLYEPVVTGPGALKKALREFMGHHRSSVNDDPYATFQRIRAGVYTGLGNWTIRVIGQAGKASDDWVARNVIYKKSRIYPQMNMTHFGKMKREAGVNESCLQRMWKVKEGGGV